MNCHSTAVTSYLENAIITAHLPETVSRVCEVLKQHKKDFDAIAFRGISGALVAPMVAVQMKKNMLVVRKKDGNHSSYGVEGDFAGNRYIIIDDIVSSGNTVKEIKTAIDLAFKMYQCKTGCKPEADFKGIVCYAQSAGAWGDMLGWTNRPTIDHIFNHRNYFSYGTAIRQDD